MSHSIDDSEKLNDLCLLKSIEKLFDVNKTLSQDILFSYKKLFNLFISVSS